MINDEALVADQEPLDAAALTTNQTNPGCLVIVGNTGNVVCNTSFTDLSDSRVKTEIAEADVAELLQLFDSVEAKQYKRPDMNGDLRLGFASDDFAGTKWKNLTGTTRWSDGTEMVTLDCSHLTSVLGGVQGLPGLDVEAQRGPKNKWKKTGFDALRRPPGTLLKLLFGATSWCAQASSHPRNCSSPFLGQEVGGPPGIPGTLNGLVGPLGGRLAQPSAPRRPWPRHVEVAAVRVGTASAGPSR